MSRRTIVGSYPRRRQAWPPGVDPDDNPRGACARAYRHHASWSRPWPRLARTCWLPPLVTALDREQLEHLLAGGTIEGLDGQPMGIDEVAP